jgi:hypothetical protein
MRNARKILLAKPVGTRPLDSPGVDGRIIVEWILVEIGWEGEDWINMAQDRDWWRALVTKVMNFRVSIKAANFLTSLKDCAPWSW